MTDDVPRTARLRLRRPLLADVPALFTFLGDPVAMRHTLCDPTLKACRRRVAVHEWRRRRDGFAPWVISLGDDPRPIGWGGLYDDPFDPGWGVELGYFFHPDVWGQGLGTEFAVATMRYADEVLRLPLVRAFAKPANIGSRRVLARAGFVEERYVPEMERLLFRREGKSLLF